MEWRDVRGFEGLYRVSDEGAVRSGRSGQNLTSTSHGPLGYRRVTLARGGVDVKRYVHQLVARAFLGDPEPGQEVRHMDNHPTNNRVGNLRWGTRAENIGDQMRAGTHPQASKTHCPSGHEYTEENTWRPADRSRRYCRACARERRAAA